VNRDILYTAALFHDIGKGTEPHNEVGARATRDLLGDICQPEELDRICLVILRHNQKQSTDTYEPATRLVQDADVLDHIGPIEVWLGFWWDATHGMTIDDRLRYYHSQENSRRQAVMRSALNFDIWIGIYERRLKSERAFFVELDRVHRGGL
jgi:uncharacterized protein